MRRPQLDGLRFFLFVSIFFLHHFPVEMEFLGYALPVFFVLSGFLITRVLLSIDQPSLLGRLRIFYIRRALRICPAYFVVLALLWGAGALTYPYHYLAYILNLKLFVLSLTTEPRAFMEWFNVAWRHESLHLWSLSVEEQFYLLYPLLLYVTPPVHRVRVLLAVWGLSVAARVGLSMVYPHSFYSALLPVTMEYFVWGCLFAWLMESNRLTRLPAALILPLSAAGVAVTLFVEFYFRLNGFFQFRTSAFQTPIAVLLGFFVWSLWAVERTNPIARVLSWPPFVYLGSMSYTMYLVHLMTWDIHAALNIQLPLGETLNRIVVTFVLIVLMSMTIWHLVEKPVNSLGRYLPYGKDDRADGIKPARREAADAPMSAASDPAPP